MIDIIIPFHGAYELVTKCVSSIYSCTPNQNYKIILVDDASPNKMFVNDISQGKRITKLRLEEQVGFGGAVAAGLAHGKGSHVVIMHSDVQVNNIQWLANLQKGLETLRESKVKLVSARTNDPGTSASYDPALIGTPEDEVENTIVKTCLPLICTYCHKDLFKMIRGPIKSYPYAWYEDEELFWRMKYYNYNQAVIGNSWVNHVGGGTINELLNRKPKLKSLMENNRNLCLNDVRPFLPRR